MFSMYSQNINPSSLANTVGMLFQGTGTNVYANGTQMPCLSDYFGGYNYGCCDDGGISNNLLGYIIGSSVFNMATTIFNSARAQRAQKANAETNAWNKVVEEEKNCQTQVNNLDKSVENQKTIVDNKKTALQTAEQAKNSCRAIATINSDIATAKTALETAQTNYTNNSSDANQTALNNAKKNLEKLQKELKDAQKAEDDYNKAKKELNKENAKLNDLSAEFDDAKEALEKATEAADAMEAQRNAKKQIEQIDKVDGNWFSDVLHKDNIEYDEKGQVKANQDYSNITKYDVQKLLSKYRKANDSEKETLKTAIKAAYNNNKSNSNVITKDLETVIKTIID